MNRFKCWTCLMYIDYIIVFSNNLHDHRRHVRDVMTVQWDAGITLKLKKSRSVTEMVNYCGNVIRSGRLMINQARLKPLVASKEPRSRTKLSSIHGFVNFYQRFIQNFSEIAAPLNALLREKQPPKLETLPPVKTATFQLLRKALNTAPILSLSQNLLPYSIDTDSSDYQVGCDLFRTTSEGNRRPIGYFYCTLKVHECSIRYRKGSAWQ